jgi:FhuF 2Fe-2S C-terminal domain
VSGLVAATASVPGPPRPEPAGPSLVGLLAGRLRGLDPDDPGRYTVTDLVQPRGWIPPGQLIAVMMSGSGEHLTISPAVAGARMAGSLGYAVAGRLAVALAVAAQAHGPDSLLFQVDDEGLVERVAVRRPELAVLSSDPLAGRPGARVLPEPADLIAWAADRAWSTLDPLIAELHQASRYGVVPIWNLVADSILGPATSAPLLAGRDQAAGRAVGVALIEALIGCGAPIRRRGTARAELVEGRLVLASVRGSCCLYFRQNQELCDSCPLAQK